MLLASALGLISKPLEPFDLGRGALSVLSHRSPPSIENV
jgi:hypothetical protein